MGRRGDSGRENQIPEARILGPESPNTPTTWILSTSVPTHTTNLTGTFTRKGQGLTGALHKA